MLRNNFINFGQCIKKTLTAHTFYIDSYFRLNRSGPRFKNCAFFAMIQHCVSRLYGKVLDICIRQFTVFGPHLLAHFAFSRSFICDQPASRDRNSGSLCLSLTPWNPSWTWQLSSPRIGSDRIGSYIISLVEATQPNCCLHPYFGVLIFNFSTVTIARTHKLLLRPPPGLDRS